MSAEAAELSTDALMESTQVTRSAPTDRTRSTRSDTKSTMVTCDGTNAQQARHLHMYHQHSNSSMKNIYLATGRAHNELASRGKNGHASRVQ
jgi:hypothetical protein